MKTFYIFLSVGFTAGEVKHRGGPDIDECRAGNEEPKAIMTGVLEYFYISDIKQQNHRRFQLGL